MIYKNLLIWILSLTITTIEAANQSVYIYAGNGTSTRSLIQTESAIKPFLNSHYRIEYIFPDQIINDSWEKQTALLIIPGGADIPFTKALNGPGNKKIRSFVENGGAFLGICAGSYYGGNFVDFAKNTPLEVLGERELAFFPGIVRGPTLAPYAYNKESGSRAANILWKGSSGFPLNDTFLLYANGSGHFVDATKASNTTVLATYSMPEELAAIVECKVGNGKAILSAVHFEYNPYLLDSNDSYLQKIIPELKAGNAHRLELVKHLLERLNLKTKK